MVKKTLKSIWFWIAFLPSLYLLGGFYLVPWLVQSQLPPMLKEKFHLNLSLEHLSFNPLTYELHLGNVQLHNEEKEPILGLKHVYVDYELSALFKKSILFKTIVLDEPFADVRIDTNGTLNVVSLFSALLPSQEPNQTHPEEESTALPLSIAHLEIVGAKGKFNDVRGEKPFNLDVGPIHYTLNNLHFSKDDLSVHALKMALKDQEKITLASSLSLDPLRFHGELRISRFHLPLIYDYVAPKVSATLLEGYVSATIPFTLDLSKEPLQATIEKASVHVEELIYHDSSSQKVLEIPSLTLDAIDFRWPEATLSINALTLTKPFVSLLFEKDYALNLITLFTPKQHSTPPQPKEAASQTHTPSFHAVLNQLQILEGNIDIVDRNVKGSKINLSNLSISTDTLSTDFNQSIAYTLSSTIDKTSSLTLKGSFNPQKNILVTHMDAKKIDCAKAQPYLSPFTTITLAKGLLSSQATLSLNLSKTFSLLYKGDVTLSGLSINDETGTSLLSWDTLLLSQVVYNTQPSLLHVKKIALSKPYINLDIKKDKSTNFSTLIKESPAPSKKVSSTKKAPPSKETPMEIVIGDVLLKGGSASFKDASLPIPFATLIHHLNGSFSTFNTKSSKPSVLNLEGKVDKYGYAKIGGNLLPLDFKDRSNLKILFKNIDMPSLTPYSGKFIGYAIAKGKLSMDLSYKIKQGKMEGDNKINLDSLTLGEKIESEDATSLPLAFAIAVLKDSKGQIDIDLPVSGDLNDPDFKYGALVWKAIGNLLGSIITSPFSLLGSMLGIETETLKSIDFAGGEFELIASEEEKMEQYKAILEKKPGLKLTITPSFNEALDTLSLQEKALNTHIETLLAKTKKEEDAYTRALKDLFIQKFAKEAYDAFMAQANEQKLEKGAINEGLSTKLAQSMVVTPEQLQALAQKRADLIIQNLVQKYKVSAEKLSKTELQTSEAVREKWVGCAVNISN